MTTVVVTWARVAPDEILLHLQQKLDNRLGANNFQKLLWRRPGSEP